MPHLEVDPRSDLSLAETLELAGSDDRLTRMALADSPHLRAEVARLLAKDSAPLVRSMLAKNSKTPRDVLEALLEADSENVLSSLAANRSLPVDLQERVEASGTTAIKSALAGNPALAPHLQKKLYGLRPSIDFMMVQNSNLSEDLQEAYSRSQNRDVRQFLSTNTGLVERLQIQMLDEESTSEKPDQCPVALGLSGNSNLCREVQYRLATHSDWLVRSTLAGNVALEWNEDTPVQFLLAHKSDLVLSLLTGTVDDEAVLVLAGTWTGTVAEIVEAAKLTRR